MNKELRERLYKFLDDNDWGWQRDGLDEIIDMCQQDFLKRALKSIEISCDLQYGWTQREYATNALKEEFEK